MFAIKVVQKKKRQFLQNVQTLWCQQIFVYKDVDLAKIEFSQIF